MVKDLSYTENNLKHITYEMRLRVMCKYSYTNYHEYCLRLNDSLITNQLLLFNIFHKFNY